MPLCLHWVNGCRRSWNWHRRTLRLSRAGKDGVLLRPWLHEGLVLVVLLLVLLHLSPLVLLLLWLRHMKSRLLSPPLWMRRS